MWQAIFNPTFPTRRPEATGRPGYAPGDLLKLYIYGYLNRIRSSRRLEAETHRNVEVIWLLRHLKPDFKTIADFRRNNRNAFRSVFRQFVLLCRQLNLFGRELLAVDGTRIKAVNNKDRNFTRASLAEFIKIADAKLDNYLQRHRAAHRTGACWRCGNYSRNGSGGQRKSIDNHQWEFVVQPDWRNLFPERRSEF
ncbi:MAG: transposase [Acetobacteraceae bacterium]|nr:transposase [Acetobacteraceae bacterium]